ncbi:MAG: winged helix-turn-helix domain-containing protein [Alloprevotella sp.]
MKKLPLIAFLFIMASALCSCLCSYHRAMARIEADVNQALRQTLAKMPCEAVSTDTIRCYRSYLTIRELKDTAGIALRTVRRRGRLATEMVAQANCSLATVWLLSDQRASGSLLFVGLLWMAGSLWYMHRRSPVQAAQGVCYGGMVYANDRFTTSEGDPIVLTPMQHTLLEMFMNAEGHTLSKQEICNRLWPKKPDATATLYTLVKRIKPVIEANSRLRIESDRGRSYSLKIR